MRIELTLRRKGGSIVEMADGTKYHFAPSAADPRHIADVTKKDHIRRLLSIEGYDIADGEDDDTAPQTKTPIERPEASDASDLIRLDLSDVEDEEPEDGEGEDDPAEKIGDALTDEELRARFEATLGRAPHPAMKRDNLIAKIREAIEMQNAGA